MLLGYTGEPPSFCFIYLTNMLPFNSLIVAAIHYYSPYSSIINSVLTRAMRETLIDLYSEFSWDCFMKLNQQPRSCQCHPNNSNYNQVFIEFFIELTHSISVSQLRYWYCSCRKKWSNNWKVRAIATTTKKKQRTRFSMSIAITTGSYKKSKSYCSFYQGVIKYWAVNKHILNRFISCL